MTSHSLSLYFYYSFRSKSNQDCNIALPQLWSILSEKISCKEIVKIVDASASIWQRKTRLGSPSIFWRAKRVFSQFMTNVYSNEFLCSRRDLKVQFLYIWKFFQVKRILQLSTVFLFWHSCGWSQHDSSTNWTWMSLICTNFSIKVLLTLLQLHFSRRILANITPIL